MFQSKLKFKMKWMTYHKKIKPPTPPPPYSPPNLLTANEIKTEREIIKAEFLKISLLLNKD